MKNKRRLLWIARTCTIIAFVGISITSYCFYAPYVYPSLWRQIGQPMAHVIAYGGPLLFISALAWRYPAAGGIIAVLYSAFQFWQLWLRSETGIGRPEALVPEAVLIILYGLFFVGGIMNVVLGIIQERKKPAKYNPAARLLWTARVTAFIPIILNVIMHGLINPMPFVLGSVPGIITAGIAWFWPAPGGFLMLLLTIPGFFLLLESNWDFQLKMPVYIFCLVFIASGFLHLIIAWRSRKMRAG